jgi:membrane associated rhomboid family serine protease
MTRASTARKRCIRARIVHTLLGWFPIRIPAWIFLGGWFLYQFFESNYALVHPSKSGDSGVAFFAHAGGFAFRYVIARILLGAGRITAQ